MKRLLISIVFAILTVSAVGAQDSARDRTDLTRLLDEFLIGAGSNDPDMHDRFWADDLIYTRSIGQRIGKAELIKGVRSAKPPKPGDPVTIYSAEDVRVQQYGDAAVVAFRLVGTTVKDGKTQVSRFLNTGTFVRRKKKWRVVAWQATGIPSS
ncbi:MAG: nuclear transport factor 2 family protein [Blastocatellia bacterium]|nr:nuclear transport factor 2 family protein [Blastocatellia bacterium]